MKKIAGVLCVMVWMLIPVMALGAGNKLEYKSLPFYDDKDFADVTSEDWYKSEERRGLLTVLLTIELSEVEKEFDINALLDSYVGVNKNDILFVLLVSEENSCAYEMIVSPQTQTAEYAVMNLGNANTMGFADWMMKNLCTQYNRNSADTVLNIADAILEEMESDE